MLTPGKRTLVIESATPVLSLALFEGDRLLAADHALLGRGHAEAIVPRIAALPDQGRADEIVVDAGPGSFTGIRVGLAAARALGFAWGAPVRGYSCLSLCAAMVRARGGEDGAGTLAIVMIGGHGELFWQRFRSNDLAPLAPPASHPATALSDMIPEAAVHGSGAAQLVAARGWGEAVECLPDARSFPLLPPEHLEAIARAAYGRGADAIPMAGTPA